jgi:hypothetical protein
MHTYMGRGATGPRGKPRQIRLLVPGMGECGGTLHKPCYQPYLIPEPDQPSPWSQFYLKDMVPKEH